ncbi:MAG TPA: hypothetical protein VLA88_04435 [Candidatus Saccharimonadales bacterium]|nr:hypothetical protein [Candidatus Saccharimonadales bacterium]
MLWFKKKNEPTRQPRLLEGQNDYVFRRSRTLTGSISNEVTASVEHRGHLKTDRLKLHELKAHRRSLLRLLGVVLLIIAGLTFLVANFVITPSVVAGQPGNQPDTHTYQQTILHYFDDHPMQRFGFMLEASALQTKLKSDHPEIANTTVSRSWYGGNVQVSLFFRQPLLVWRTGAKQFYVDAQGIAFSYNHFSEPTVSVTDQTGLPPNHSGAVASTRFIRFLGRMVGALNDYKKGNVAAIIIPPSTREIDLKLEGRDYPIKTNSDRDPLQQAEDIANALTFLDTHTIKPQYVDARVAHKAFYK